MLLNDLIHVVLSLFVTLVLGLLIWGSIVRRRVKRPQGGMLKRVNKS